MSTLTKLKLANASRNQAGETPEQRMRNRMIAHLTEQLEMATALVENRPYNATRAVREKRDDGTTVTVERDKRLRPWYWHDLSGKWFIELRYANTVLTLGKDQNAIEIGTKDKLVPTIQTLIGAVNAGELDSAMAAVVERRKRPQAKA